MGRQRKRSRCASVYPARRSPRRRNCHCRRRCAGRRRRGCRPWPRRPSGGGSGGGCGTAAPSPRCSGG
eukprot:10720696-Alexandrium_andersonii.AAC.1